MPLIQVKAIEGVFTESQKQEIVQKLTDGRDQRGEPASGDLGYRRGGRIRIAASPSAAGAAFHA